MSKDVLDDIFTPKFVWENEHYKFYTDSWTDQFRTNLAHYDNYGYAVDVKYVYLAVSKENENEKMYVAFDTQGKPFLTWTDSWDFEFRTILYKNMLRDDNNIINMAKKVKK